MTNRYALEEIEDISAAPVNTDRTKRKGSRWQEIEKMESETCFLDEDDEVAGSSQPMFNREDR